jgi:hypothetical protein
MGWRDTMSLKPIPGHPGYYADIEGGIWSTQLSEEPQKLSGTISQFGYVRIKLRVPGKRWGVQVFAHRLIAETYLPNPNNCRDINHKDGVKTNNSLDNLEWCSRSHNVKHANDLGLRVYVPGEGNGRAILTNDQVRSIRQRLKQGDKQKDIAQAYGIHPGIVSRIHTGRAWSKVT